MVPPWTPWLTSPPTVGPEVPKVNGHTNWVWMPPWRPDKITDDRREQLHAVGQPPIASTPDTRTSPTRGRGRFYSEFGCPRCASAEPRASGVETEMFHLMSFVLGKAERDIPHPRDRRRCLDMRFELRSGLILGVEFDGALWHADKQRSDYEKSRMFQDEGIVDEVMRAPDAATNWSGCWLASRNRRR